MSGMGFILLLCFILLIIYNHYFNHLSFKSIYLPFTYYLLTIYDKIHIIMCFYIVSRMAEHNTTMLFNLHKMASKIC